LNSAPPSDPDWTEKLERERQEEIQVIGDACEALGREIYEVSSAFSYQRE
jgi:OTU domain-containing protein 6